MIHERFDLNRWTELFPLAKLRKEARDFVEARRAQKPSDYRKKSSFEDHVKLMSPGGEIVTSPIHLSIVEQLRAEALSGKDLPTIPTDVFVFAGGEPPDRGVTKVGGLPFWPKERKWPVTDTGRAMDFVAQFCFSDSEHVSGELPGDILLIFAAGIYGIDWDASDSGALHFEWADRSKVRPMGPSTLPKTAWQILSVYGEIHRTVDYMDAEHILDEAYKRPWCIDLIEGTKIGGIPRWIQSEENLPGRFLCALGSVHPSMQLGEDIKRPFPFTNVSKPFTRFRDGKLQTDQLLMWDDVGSLFLFLDSEGSVHWTIQSY